MSAPEQVKGFLTQIDKVCETANSIFFFLFSISLTLGNLWHPAIANVRTANWLAQILRCFGLRCRLHRDHLLEHRWYWTIVVKCSRFCHSWLLLLDRLGDQE